MILKNKNIKFLNQNNYYKKYKKQINYYNSKYNKLIFINKFFKI